METSFCELKGKEVINIVDGKKLGRIIDLVFETSYGRILGIVVPAYNKSWNIFKVSEDIFIPYNCICKFGDDAILVRIFVAESKKPQKKGRFAKTASAVNISNESGMTEKNFQRKNQKTNNQNGLPLSNQNNSEFDQYQNYNENFEANQIFGNTFEQSKAETISTIPLYPENNASTQSQNKTSNLNVED